MPLPASRTSTPVAGGRLPSTHGIADGLDRHASEPGRAPARPRPPTVLSIPFPHGVGGPRRAARRPRGRGPFRPRRGRRARVAGHGGQRHPHRTHRRRRAGARGGGAARGDRTHRRAHAHRSTRERSRASPHRGARQIGTSGVDAGAELRAGAGVDRWPADHREHRLDRRSQPVHADERGTHRGGEGCFLRALRQFRDGRCDQRDHARPTCRTRRARRAGCRHALRPERLGRIARCGAPPTPGKPRRRIGAVAMAAIRRHLGRRWLLPGAGVVPPSGRPHRPPGSRGAARVARRRRPPRMGRGRPL